MDHLYIILEHSRFDLIYTDLHSKSFGEKYIVYFLVSQVMSLKQCQHNDHVLANIKKSAVFYFSKSRPGFSMYMLYTWTCVVSILYIVLVWSPVKCLCLLPTLVCYTDSNPWKVELCILNGDFEKKITLTFFLVSGHYWVIVFLFKKLAGLIYISVVIIDHIISLNLSV